MKSLEDIKKSLSEERPATWDDLPDIDLYMDQVLGYMHRQLYSSRPESNLTAAMVNNYIRDGLMPRTKGKKYSRSHIARLTTICVLKQVLSVGDISLLIEMFPPDTLKQVYEKYRTILDRDLSSVVEKVPDNNDPLELTDAVVRFAIASYANKVAAEHLIDMLKEQRTPDL
ncbi:MAG: DUF1836 domain-containing protein [Peptococcaceae bacterium]|nr:DUF1836 domain-containing protein [Peptococcaceae bacterium]